MVIHLGKPRRRVDMHHFTVAKKAIFLVWVKGIIRLEVIPYKVEHLVTLPLEFIHHFAVTNLVVFKVIHLGKPRRRVDIHHFTVAKKAVFLVWVKGIIQLEVIPYKVVH